HFPTIDYLAAQLAYRQFARREHAVPVQHAVFQRFGQAGEQLAMVQFDIALAHSPFHQQGSTDMAVAVAAALRAVVAQTASAIEDALARLQRQGDAGRLQGDVHQSIPSSLHSASTRATTAGSFSIARPHSRLVSPGHLWVASRPIFEPRPEIGEAKSR